MAVLNEKQLKFAQVLINDLKPGVYSAKEIYGSSWNRIEVPTTFGAKFKASVDGKLLKSIRSIEKKLGNNLQTYEID